MWAVEYTEGTFPDTERQDVRDKLRRETGRIVGIGQESTKATAEFKFLKGVPPASLTPQIQMHGPSPCSGSPLHVARLLLGPHWPLSPQGPSGSVRFCIKKVPRHTNCPRGLSRNWGGGRWARNSSSRSYLSPQQEHVGTNNSSGAAAVYPLVCPQPPQPPCCRGCSLSGPHLHPGRIHQHPCPQTPGGKGQLSQEASSAAPHALGPKPRAADLEQKYGEGAKNKGQRHERR